jgi:hypothetical protein
MRCPACGTALEAVLAPSAATQWFPCPNCHQPVPFVPPRELPPLYAWEVSPGLYPAQRVPRRARWRWRRVAAVALVTVAALAAFTAAYLGVAGVQAAQPSSYVVSGTVWEVHSGTPPTLAVGATVVLRTNDNRTTLTELTGANGTFWFVAVPNGGIDLNVTHAGYGPTDVYTFASRAYSAGTRGMTVYLAPGGPTNTSAQVQSPFPDLETFLAYVGGGAVLAAAVAVVAGLAAFALRRPGSAVVGVLGAGAAVAFPGVVLFLSLDAAFPLLAAPAGLGGGLGAFALVLAAAELSSGRSRAEPA